MAAEGFGAPEIAAQLGHSDNGVTALRWYVRSKPIASPEFIDSALQQES